MYIMINGLPAMDNRFLLDSSCWAIYAVITPRPAVVNGSRAKSTSLICTAVLWSNFIVCSASVARQFAV